jgi:hypothetical protein
MTAKRPPPDWLQPLQRSIVIPQVITLKTLWDVRELVESHLPAETRKKSTWQHVAKCSAEAARTGNTVDVYAALHMVLSMEHVPFRTK